MTTRRLAAAALSALLLAAPAPVLAQSAGDDQYQDPLGTDTGSGEDGSGGGESPAGGSPSPPASPSEPGAAGSQQVPDDDVAAGGAATSGELPRTGGDPGFIALLGLGLACLGVPLSIRSRT